MIQGQLVREKKPCVLCGHQQLIISGHYERNSESIKNDYAYYFSKEGALCLNCARAKKIV